MQTPSSHSSPSELVTRLRSLELFKAFDAAALVEIAPDIVWLHVDAAETLFQQGEHGEAMYVLVQGHMCVTVKQPNGTDIVVDELAAGSSVGEMALLTGRPRSATMTAIDDCLLLQIERAGFDRLAEKDPAAMRFFASAMLPRFQENAFDAALAGLFSSLSKVVMDDLRAEFAWQHLFSGETLFKQGDPNDTLYILVNGRLTLTGAEPGGEIVVVGEVSRGQSVGESGLLTDDPHTTTAVAVRDTDVVRLPRAAFDRLVNRQPGLMIEVIRRIVHRTRTTTGPMRLNARTVAGFAVIPAGPEVPLADFAQRLVRALEAFGPTLYLSSERLDSLMGKPGISQTSEDHPTNLALTSWLNEQEITYRHVVYQADTHWSEWSSRCVRQSDRNLIVALADGDPSLGKVELALQHLRAAGQTELVLLQPESRQRPHGTAAWLAPRTLAAHHHLHLMNDAHISRLARRLTGRALGLVLGGGGARGLSHIGVIRALEEAGLQVDMVGGTSIGGFVGGAYALGLDVDGMRNLARTFGSRKQFVDYTVPLVAFLSSRKISKVLQTLFWDVCIEDLWRPFFCISSNLTRAQPMVHRQGMLWKYVRATTAVPGVFTPLPDEGELLVDGGIMNNLPIDIMRAHLEGGPVVAVNVSPGRDPGSNYTYGTSMSGWQVLGSRLRRQPLNVPSLFGSLMRTMEINEVHTRKPKLALADLLINPPIHQFSLLQFDAWEKIIDVGYVAAQDAIETWKKSEAHQESLGLVASGGIPA